MDQAVPVTLTKQWSDAKLKTMREILSTNRINKTGRLAKSYKIKIIQQHSNQELDFYAMFYGKYVRGHYLEKGLDIWGPLKDVKDLIRVLSVDFRKQATKELVNKLTFPI